MDLPFIEWSAVLLSLGKIAAAYAFALPVAWDREQEARSAGLRTFPLVAVASCGYILFAVEIFAEAPEAQARLMEGLITGIGFIGGGAILKERAVFMAQRPRRASGTPERSGPPSRSSATRSRSS